MNRFGVIKSHIFRQRASVVWVISPCYLLGNDRRLFVEADACRRIARGQSVTLLLMQLSIAGGPRARDFRAIGCWLLVVHRILWLRFRSGFLLRFHQSFSSAFPFHPTILEPDFNLKKSSQNCAIRGPTCIYAKRLQSI